MTASQTIKPAERRGLSSVSNSLAVLEYLIESGEAGVSEIARHVKVTVGTSHRLVATLVVTGWAEQNPDNRKYRPSQKVVRLAHKMRKTISARDIAHEHLDRLVRSIHETGNIAVLSDRRVLYVDKVTSDQPFGIEARIGSRLPAHCTALGKVLVSGLDDSGLQAYLSLLKELRDERYKPTPPSPRSFRATIERARKQGYALDSGEYLPDVYCVAAPIRGSNGHVVAAMSISAPRSRFESLQPTLVRDVCAAAAALSERLQDLGLAESSLDFVSPEVV
jgi:DNA-binding IclR family transcriptional regulator